MAYAMIPEGAMKEMSTIPPAAFNLYTYYCYRRNKESGLCFPSQKTTAEETGLDYSYISTLKSKLKALGWIETTGSGAIRPLKGFENSKVESAESLKIPKLDEPKIFENSKVETEQIFENSKDNTLEFSKICLKIPKSTVSEVFENSKVGFENSKVGFENSKVLPCSEQLKLTTKTNQRGSARTRKPSANIFLPLDFQISEVMFGYAENLGDEKWTRREIVLETEQFKDHAIAKNSKYANWEAAWRTWMRSAIVKGWGVRNRNSNGASGNGKIQQSNSENIKPGKYDHLGK